MQAIFAVFIALAFVSPGSIRAAVPEARPCPEAGYISFRDGRPYEPMRYLEGELYLKDAAPLNGAVRHLKIIGSRLSTKAELRAGKSAKPRHYTGSFDRPDAKMHFTRVEKGAISDAPFHFYMDMKAADYESVEYYSGRSSSAKATFVPDVESQPIEGRYGVNEYKDLFISSLGGSKYFASGFGASWGGHSTGEMDLTITVKDRIARHLEPGFTEETQYTFDFSKPDHMALGIDGPDHFSGMRFSWEGEYEKETKMKLVEYSVQSDGLPVERDLVGSFGYPQTTYEDGGVSLAFRTITVTAVCGGRLEFQSNGYEAQKEVAVSWVLPEFGKEVTIKKSVNGKVENRSIRSDGAHALDFKDMDWFPGAFGKMNGPALVPLSREIKEVLGIYRFQENTLTLSESGGRIQYKLEGSCNDLTGSAELRLDGWPHLRDLVEGGGTEAYTCSVEIQFLFPGVAGVSADEACSWNGNCAYSDKWSGEYRR